MTDPPERGTGGRAGPHGEHALLPWEIGGPQPALLGYARTEGLRGRVLDVGCGSGEHTLLAAESGLDAVGIDRDPSAIARARQAATQRGLTACFLTLDALELDHLPDVLAATEGGDPATFDTVVDSLMSHALSDHDRERYVVGLRRVLRPGGRLLLLCYSDAQLDVPHGRRREDLTAAFGGGGWSIIGLDAVRILTTRHADGVHGWFASVVRLPDDG